MIWNSLVSLYTSSPLMFWLAFGAAGIVSLTYLLIFSICQASGRSDELTEQMIEDSRLQTPDF